MCAKTLDEALVRALTVGPLSTIRARLKSEIKEYISFELLGFQDKMRDHKNFPEMESILLDWFHGIFKE